jgi:hypothetical protein
MVAATGRGRPPSPPPPSPAPFADRLPPDTVVVSCSKGILNGTLETVEQLLQRVLPEEAHARLAFLSGPSFAKEVRPPPPARRAVPRCILQSRPGRTRGPRSLAVHMATPSWPALLGGASSAAAP